MQRVNHVIDMAGKPPDAPKMLVAGACHLALNIKIPTKGLIIDDLHLDKILDGTGSWEMRTGFTHHSQSVALIKQGGLIVGIANLVGIKRPLNYKTHYPPIEQERLSEERLQSGEIDNWDIAWVLENARPLMTTVSCQALNDAADDGWINLEPYSQEQLLLAMALRDEK